MVDVVIVSDGSSPRLKTITERAIDSLFESEDNIKFNVFVVEGSAAEYPTKDVELIRPDTPFNYHRYLNEGVKAGSSEFVCLCNNDLFFHKGWASAMIRAMRENQEILSASPRQPKEPKRENNVVSGYRIMKEIKGWCIFQRRMIYEKILKLDEFLPFYCCDHLYANQLKENKILHALISDSEVSHISGATFRKKDLKTKEFFSARRARGVLDESGIKISL